MGKLTDKGVVCETYRGYHIRSVYGIDHFIAWASTEPLTGDNPIDEPFNIDVYFEFGDTREQAVYNIHMEIDTLLQDSGGMIGSVLDWLRKNVGPYLKPLSIFCFLLLAGMSVRQFTGSDFLAGLTVILLLFIGLL